MIKKSLYGDNLKARLKAAAKDRLYHFTMARDTVRAVLLHGTRMVNEMRANHDLGILETLMLGHAYMGAGLMSTTLKGNDRLSLQVESDGPAKGFVVEANAFAEVRGYLKTVPIPIEKPLESFDLSPFFGSGFLIVTRYLEDAKHPFTGKIKLKYGNIGQDLAHYCLTSEQIPTAVHLSIRFDKQGEVVGAGGLLVQALPGAADQVVAELEKEIETIRSPGEAFARDISGQEFIDTTFGQYGPRMIADRRIEFMCHCNQARLRSVLSMLPVDELTHIYENGPYPVELRCHHCNTSYPFDRDEIGEIYRKRLETATPPKA